MWRFRLSPRSNDTPSLSLSQDEDVIPPAPLIDFPGSVKAGERETHMELIWTAFLHASHNNCTCTLLLKGTAQCDSKSELAGIEIAPCSPCFWHFELL